MKKEMFFGISFYFAVCARSVAIRFVGVRCRGTHFAATCRCCGRVPDTAALCSGRGRIIVRLLPLRWCILRRGRCLGTAA